MMLVNKLIEFLVDNRSNIHSAEYKSNQGMLDTVMVIGETRQLQKQAFLQPLECQVGNQKIVHSFLYVLGFPSPLLGPDLLCKLHTQITFSPEKQQLCIEDSLEHALQLQVLLTCLESPGGEVFPPEICEQVDQTIWADGTAGKAVNVQHINLT